MAIDQDQRDEILNALAGADAVDAQNIDIRDDAGVVVLHGTVATFEESSAAEHIARQHADDVRNELNVDHNLREGAAGVRDTGELGRTATAETSAYNPVEQPDDLVTGSQESLDENVPWDPPHEPVEVPTRAESRGTADRTGQPGDPDAALLDEARDPDAKSLPDVSPQELRQAAHPAHDDERH